MELGEAHSALFKATLVDSRSELRPDHHPDLWREDGEELSQILKLSWIEIQPF